MKCTSRTVLFFYSTSTNLIPELKSYYYFFNLDLIEINVKSKGKNMLITERTEINNKENPISYNEIITDGNNVNTIIVKIYTIIKGIFLFNKALYNKESIVEILKSMLKISSGIINRLKNGIFTEDVEIIKYGK